ncbi:hypothetical protein [Geminocystis sp. NIES-3709]|uniref:hypothetical protein n=1 Tax=Geminocystis sp. NIES-3709 TaxID=1617448 RepID=UPI0005FC85AD|nr:hypothetical protein [Geminocystis sp. NIES-3709]BAQ65532.1 hypothetical protein GM3709_2297 [Geminocystis sp. NIES-3709]
MGDNNWTQTMTQKEALEKVESLNLPIASSLVLTNLIISYSWMSSQDITIDATFDEIIDLFLADLSRSQHN